MKKFKLILATVLVFVMTFALVACSAPVVGEWELIKAKGDGYSVTGDELEDYFGEVELIINSDGTGEISIKYGSSKTTEEFEWKLNDDQDELTFEYDDGSETEWDIEIDGDKIEVDYDDYTLTFKKK